MTQKSPHAKDKIIIRPRRGRKRFLNIIYFIDSNRTRTLKFSIRKSYLTVGTLILLVSWSMIASLLLLREHALNTEQRARSRNLLSVIFNYQTRYDQVYEIAYPNDGSPLMAAAESPDPANKLAVNVNQEGQADTESRVELPSEPNAAKLIAISMAAKAKAAIPSILAEVTTDDPKERVIANTLEKLQSGEPPVVVENFSSAIHEDTLTIRFALKNTNKGNKATGSVTAQARYFEEGKEGAWIPTQEISSEELTDTGDQDDPSSDQHFNIRYYKNKVFHFTSPAKSTGLFTGVRITVKDEQGRSKDFAFPLTKEPRFQQSKVERSPVDETDPETLQ